MDQASITLLVKPALQNLVEPCPYVDEVLTYEPPSSRYLRPFQATSSARRLAQRHLRKGDFDLAIMPRWDADSYYASMVTYLSGARNRVTYSEQVNRDKQTNNPGLDRLFTHVLNQTAAKHEVRKNLDLIRYLGGTVKDDKLELWLSDDDKEFAESILSCQGNPAATRLVALAPGARAARRTWPISRFVDLGKCLRDKHKFQFVVVGSEAEKQLGIELKMALGDSVIDTVGQTTLRQTAAILRRCHLFIGNDS